MADVPDSNKSDYLYQLSSQKEYGEIVKHIRYHDDPHVRFGAAGILSETIHAFKSSITPPEQKALVDTVLNDPVNEVRAKVVEILLAVNEDAIDNIITQLSMNPQETPTEQPYPLVLTHWHASAKPGLQFLAIVGFGRVGNASSINKLRTTIANGSSTDMDLRVLRRAIEEAGEIGNETFVTPIQRQLRRNDDDFPSSADKQRITAVREAAVEALIEIGTDAAYEALVTASRSTDENLKQHALSEIGRFGVEDTVDLMIDQLNEKNSEDVRGEAAEGLITSFKETDREKSHEIREKAIQLIADETDYDASNEFASIIDESDDVSEQRNAAWLIGQIDDSTEDAADTLSSVICDSDDEYLKKIAAGSLTQLDEDDVQPKIASVLQTVDEDSDAHDIASFVEDNLHDESQEAKRNLVEYTRVTSPSDYGTTE